MLAKFYEHLRSLRKICNILVVNISFIIHNKLAMLFAFPFQLLLQKLGPAILSAEEWKGLSIMPTSVKNT